MKCKPWTISISSVLILLFATCIFAAAPDCADPDRWPGRMAYVYLENDRILNHDVTDFAKTKVKRLASEKIGKDLYRQVHLIKFTKKNGEQVTVITVNNASNAECSESPVDVYVVSKTLGDPPNPQIIKSGGKAPKK